ncbi:hypothetical protein PtB15_6B422 [Puccinia triticina]|nr:hypothetical protein PtB15_6B422 [Puccinia triticina]
MVQQYLVGEIKKFYTTSSSELESPLSEGAPFSDFSSSAFPYSLPESPLITGLGGVTAATSNRGAFTG